MLCKLWCTVLTVMASSLEIKQDFRSFSTQILQITHSIRNQKNELALSTPEDVSGNVEDSTPIRSSERWVTKVGCGTGWIQCLANKTCFPAYSLAIDGGVICNPMVSMYHWCARGDWGQWNASKGEKSNCILIQGWRENIQFMTRPDKNFWLPRDSALSNGRRDRAKQRRCKTVSSSSRSPPPSSVAKQRFLGVPYNHRQQHLLRGGQGGPIFETTKTSAFSTNAKGSRQIFLTVSWDLLA